jgi:hypothetical protein
MQLKCILPLIILIALFFAAACNKPDKVTPPEISVLTAVIEGDTFRPDFIRTKRNVDTFEIFAVEKDSTWLSIIFRHRRTAPATYTIGGFPDEFNNAYVNFGKNQLERFTTELAMGSGSITVDSINTKQIFGTFRFNASDLGNGSPNSVRRINAENGRFSLFWRQGIVR